MDSVFNSLCILPQGIAQCSVFMQLNRNLKAKRWYLHSREWAWSLHNGQMVFEHHQCGMFFQWLTGLCRNCPLLQFHFIPLPFLQYSSCAGLLFFSVFEHTKSVPFLGLCACHFFCLEYFTSWCLLAASFPWRVSSISIPSEAFLYYSKLGLQLQLHSIISP